jgi:hypothetical protein
VHASGKRKLLARLLAVKITAAFALTAVGGAALAAAGGLTRLPGGSGPGPAAPTTAPSPAPTTAPSPAAPPTTPGAGAPASSPRTPPAPAPSAPASPENPARPRPTAGTRQPWDHYRNDNTTGPDDSRSYQPQRPRYPGQNQNGQFGTRTADRDTSPRPGSRSARTSSPPVGNR